MSPPLTPHLRRFFIFEHELLYGVKEYREDVFSKTVGLLLILPTSVEFLFLYMNLPGIDREFSGIRDDTFASGLNQYLGHEFENCSTE